MTYLDPLTTASYSKIYINKLSIVRARVEIIILIRVSPLPPVTFVEYM